MRLRLPLLAACGLALSACGSMGLDDAKSDGTWGEAVLEPAGELSFGLQSPYGRPASMTVEILSTGVDPVTVEDAWVETDDPDAIYVGDIPFPMTIEPDNVVPFSVKFKPTRSGNFHGVLNIGLQGGALIERNVVGSGCNDGDQDGVCNEGGGD